MPLDIALGLIGAFLQAYLGGEDLTVSLLLVGVLFTLLPDVDFLVSWLRKGDIRQVDHTHRELLHHPVPYLALGALLVWLVAPQYVFLFVGLSLAHFVHDSIGVGWGIPWLSPMSMRHTKFFTRRDNRPAWLPVVMTWTQAERAALIARHHNPDWIRATYQRVTWTLGIELAAFLCAVLSAFLLSLYF